MSVANTNNLNLARLNAPATGKDFIEDVNCRTPFANTQFANGPLLFAREPGGSTSLELKDEQACMSGVPEGHGGGGGPCSRRHGVRGVWVSVGVALSR
jgi:hypothetical protein